ncbi:MAG TPA: hypothetical protein VFC41_00155 [Anaerovoracaceae bacterium]|nr:hypothetical protein [Anaerovoracaceae bacterium]
MQTKTFTQIYILENQYEVVGCGDMPTQPVQVGEWWVLPAEQYQGKIPKGAVQKLFFFLNQGIPIKGVLIADDMKKIEYQKDQDRKKKEMTEKVAKVGVDMVTTFATAAVGIAVGMATMLFYALAYDPMLVVCLDDGSGRWVCVYSWFD